jgi:hypothetical protein
MTYKQEERRRTRVLELALASDWSSSRAEHRAVFALLEKQGYCFGGYKRRLEETLHFLNKAIAAVNALEGNQ